MRYQQAILPLSCTSLEPETFREPEVLYSTVRSPTGRRREVRIRRRVSIYMLDNEFAGRIIETGGRLRLEVDGGWVRTDTGAYSSVLESFELDTRSYPEAERILEAAVKRARALPGYASTLDAVDRIGKRMRRTA